MAVLWTPEFIDTALWLDAADSSTITESGGAVSEWTDKSVNGYLFGEYSSGGYLPSVGVETVNGLNVITFTDGFLEETTLRYADARALFVVVGPLDGSEVMPIIGDSVSREDGVFIRGGTDYSIKIEGNDGKFGYASVDGNPPTIYGGEIELGLSVEEKQAPRVWYVQWDGANQFNRVASYRTGVGHRLTGSLAEIILLSDVPPDYDRQQIEGYLAHKWGLEASLPSDHLYKTSVPQRYTISGVITGSDGNPAARAVRLYDRSTGLFLGETTSDATTGAYEIVTAANGESQRVVLADEATLHNHIIDRVIPA